MPALHVTKPIINADNKATVHKIVGAVLAEIINGDNVSKCKRNGQPRSALGCIKQNGFVNKEQSQHGNACTDAAHNVKDNGIVVE